MPLAPEPAPSRMPQRAPAPEEVVGLLADRCRRRVIARLDAEGPASIGELVAALGLPAREVVESLERLAHAGVVVAAGDEYSFHDEVLQRSVREAAQERVGDLGDEHTRIFRRYFFRNRLVQIPSEPAALEAVLTLIAEDFQPGEEYSEREVNTTLYGWHGDWAALRRLLVDNAYLTRERGVYRRAAATA